MVNTSYKYMIAQGQLRCVGAPVHLSQNSAWTPDSFGFMMRLKDLLTKRRCCDYLGKT
jgi:hypothetical protein